MLATILNLEKPAVAHRLNDVAEKHWANANIGAILDAGLMGGYPDGTFRPEQGLTRAEMVTIISRWKQEQLESVLETRDFEDIHDHWAADNIRRLAGAGWVQGYPGNVFQPDTLITRAEVVVLLNRLLDRGPLLGIEEKIWEDVNDHHWAKEHIYEASIPHRSKSIETGEVLVD